MIALIAVGIIVVLLTIIYFLPPIGGGTSYNDYKDEWLKDTEEVQKLIASLAVHGGCAKNHARTLSLDALERIKYIDVIYMKELERRKTKLGNLLK